MANRIFSEDRLALQKRLIDVFAVVNVGAAGAVTLQAWNYPSLGQLSGVARTYTAAPTTGGGSGYPNRYAQGVDGIFSVARTGAGLWTVTFQDSYERLLGLKVFPTLAGGLSAIVGVAQNSTITNMAAVGGSIVGVTLLSATATALDPASGEQIGLHFLFQDATEP